MLSQDLDQVVSLLAIVLLVGATSVMAEVSSPKVKINPPMSPGDEADLLKKFMQLSAPLQRGCLKYASEMRHSYQREKLKLS